MAFEVDEAEVQIVAVAAAAAEVGEGFAGRVCECARKAARKLERKGRWVGIFATRCAGCGCGVVRSVLDGTAQRWDCQMLPMLGLGLSSLSRLIRIVLYP